MLIFFLEYLVVLLIALCATYLIGYLILGNNHNSGTQKHFILLLRLVLGSVFISVVTSVIYTHGKTINIGLIFLLGIIFLQNKSLKFSWHLPRINLKDFKLFISDLCSLSIVGVFVFIIKFSFIYSPDGVPLPPHPDYSFYSRLANFISSTGKETKAIDYIFTETTPYLPYHYFELWISIAYQKVFNSNALFTLILVSSTIGVVIVWTGICALYESVKKVGWGGYILCFILLFFAGLTISTSTENWLTRDVSGFFINVFSYPKLQFIFIFILLFFGFHLNKKPLFAFYSLLVLPLIYFTTIFGIFFALGSYSLLNIIFYRENRKMMIKVLVASIMIGIFILGFYLILNYNKESLGKTGNSYIDLRTYIKTGFNVFAGSVLRTFYIYILVFIILIIGLTKETIKDIAKSEYFIISFLVFLFSLLAWTILHPLTDSVQFLTNLGFPFLNIFLIYVIFLVFSEVRRAKRALIVFVLIIGFGGNVYFYIQRAYQYRVSKEYILATREKIKDLNHLGGYLRHGNEYGNLLFFYSTVSILGEFSTMFFSDFHTISLSDFEGAEIHKQAIKNHDLIDKQGSFYKFVQKQKENGDFKNYDHSKLNFVKEYDIEFIFASKDVHLPQSLSTIVRDSIIDEVSGERLYLFKN